MRPSLKNLFSYPARLIPTLDCYVLARFLGIYIANTVSFTFIYVLVDVVNNLERFARHTNSAGELIMGCARYYAAMIPVTFCQILGPVVAVAAALFTVTSFQRANEFVPVLATGRSYQRTLAPILWGGGVCAVGLFLVQELWIPRSIHSIMSALETRSGKDTISNFKYFDEEFGNLIVLRTVYRFQARAEGVLVMPVTETQENQSLVIAESMTWQRPENEAGYWKLQKAQVQEYDRSARLVIHEHGIEKGAPPKLSQSFPEYRILTRLIPEDFELREKESVYMDLASLARHVEEAPDANRWRIKYMARFSAPLAGFLLILLGLPVIVFYGNRNVFVGALLAVVVATGYFLTHSFFQELGVRGHLPANVGAWIAPSVFFALGATLYRDMRS